MEPGFLTQLSPPSHVGRSLSPRSDHARPAHQRPSAARTDGCTPDRNGWDPKALGALTCGGAAGTARPPEFRLGAGRPGYATPGLRSRPAGRRSPARCKPSGAASGPNPGPRSRPPARARTHHRCGSAGSPPLKTRRRPTSEKERSIHRKVSRK